MEKTIVLIKNGEIMFHSHLGVSVDISCEIPIQKLMTKYGLLIPLETRSLTAVRLLRWLIPDKDPISLDFISNIDHEKMTEKTASLLITPTGELFMVYAIDIKTGKFLTNYLSYDLDASYGIGMEHGTDDITKSALACTDTMDEAVDTIYKTLPFFFKQSFKIYKIDELVEWIKSCIIVPEGPLPPFTGTIRRPNCIADIEVVEILPPSIPHVTKDDSIAFLVPEQ
jgi:hypothetical protein